MHDQSNFASDILEAAKGESIISIVIGKNGWDDEEDGSPLAPIIGKVISWEAARPLLSYDYDTGYGSPECHAITAWTENKVIFVSQYDGATSVCTVPRNPVDHLPDMPGGG